MITRPDWPTLLLLACLAAAAIDARAIAAESGAAATGTVPAASANGSPAAAPAPAPAALTPLQVEVAKVLGTTHWPQSLGALKAILASHTVAEQIDALMPFLDTCDKNPPADSIYFGFLPSVPSVLGEIGEPAVPAVAAALADPLPSRRRAAAMALERMASHAHGRNHTPGASTIPRLTELLASNPSDDVRCEAASALSWYGREVDAALIAALDDRSADVRRMILNSLAFRGPDVWPATAKLAKLLNQQGVDEYDLERAAEALGSIGPGAREAIPALIEALDKEKGQLDKEDGQEDGRFSRVNWALDVIGGIKPEHAEALIRAIPKAKAAAAAKALKELKPSDPRAAEGLIKALDHVEYWNGYVFGDAIASLAAPNFATLDALRTRMAGKRPETRIWAAYAFFRLTGDAKAARDAINTVAFAASDDARQNEHKSSAARALAMMGRAAAPAADMLRKQIPAVSNSYREWFTRALLEAVGEFDVAIPLLVEDLAPRDTDANDESYDERATAALVAIGPAAAEAAAPALERLVNLSVQGSRHRGAETLANMGPSDATRATLPSLKRMLSAEEVPYVRRPAAEAIWQITHDAATVVPALVELLKERGREFPNVVGALKSMGPAAKEAAPALQKIRDADPNPTFRQYAAEALAAIVPAKDPPQRPAGDAEFARWWEDLKSEETHVAGPAVWRFAEAGDAALAFLREHTKGGIEELRKRLQSDVGKETPAELAKVEGCGGEIRRFYRARQAISLRTFLAAQAKPPR